MNDYEFEANPFSKAEDCQESNIEENEEIKWEIKIKLESIKFGMVKRYYD